jgi:hypothetical protein
MGTLSIHNLDPAVEERIRQQAKASGKSLNQTIKELLAEAVRPAMRTAVERRRDFERFANTWTEEEANDFNRRVEEMCGRIDQEDWA